MVILLATFATFTPLAIRVEGRGFLRLDHKGRLAYTSQATLTVKSGLIVTTDGDILLPEIAVPATVRAITVGLDGTVHSGDADYGRLVLAKVGNEPVHQDLFFSVIKPTLGSPGEGLFGVIRMGAGSKSAPQKITSSKTSSVSVRALTELAPGNYTLADVATITAPDDETAEKLRTLVLGPCPAIGVERLISGSLLTAKIRGLGLTPAQFSVDVPDGAKVIGKSQTLSSDAILALAIKAAQDDTGGAVTYQSTSTPSRLVLPPGDMTTSQTIENKSISALQVRISVSIDGHIVTSRLVSLVPEPGTAMVRSGDTVIVRLVQHGAVVEMSAKATSAGLKGQNITVQTAGSPGLTMNATVLATGLVEVRLS